jgi:hypothetical protein
MGLVYERVLTAPIAAIGLLAGFGVAVASGSRPLGGVVLTVCGVTCIVVWLRRDGARTAAALTVASLVAFAVSHVLGHAIGAWPSVILVAAVSAGICWRLSDSRAVQRASRSGSGARPGTGSGSGSGSAEAGVRP